MVERAILVGTARRGDRTAGLVEEHLAELARLTDTAGAAVVGRLVQRVAAPTPRFLLGSGKVTQLKALAEETNASLIIFDQDLSPSQGRNLERALERRIMDRSEVILDIFARRARSKEARLEVELAQLEYLLPRLARMWVHLSRIRGGIGLRGPGETQIETDRRMIRRKITTLKRKLEDVATHRAVVRSARRSIPTAALVGYTNAGKSSLLKTLTGAETLIEDRLFATLDTLTREVSIAGTAPPAHRSPLTVETIRLVDTVGFIRKLPHHLVASFRATLEEAEQADLLLHVIDAAHPDWEEQVAVVDGVLADLPRLPGEVVHVFNKMDLVQEPEVFRRQTASRFDPAVFVSAARGEVGDLIRAVEHLAERKRDILRGMSPSPSVDSLQASLAPLAREAGLRLLVLFGSSARGDGQPSRDLDLGALPTGAFDSVGFTNAVIRRLGLQAVDLTNLRHADPLLLLLVAREGIPLYQAEPGEFARFASLAARRYADTRKFRAAVREQLAEFVARGRPA